MPATRWRAALTRDDFELLEDGKPVTIATFAEAQAPTRGRRSMTGGSWCCSWTICQPVRP